MNNNSLNSAPPINTPENDLERKINILERISCSLDARAAMVVVALGLKPSASINLYKRDECIDQIKQKMRAAGLFFDDIDKPPFKTEIKVGDSIIQKSPGVVETASLAIARSQEVASRVADLFRNTSEDREYQLGRYLGYPVTATEASLGKREKLGDLHPFIERRIPSTLQFILSKDYWQEELKTSTGWLKAIKEKSPELYKQIIEEKSSEYEGVPPILD
ncbi:MAG: hypothetical protein EXS50_03210 [Candidatus Taylorbacteria bacterium]|nr:hypothetical protein [Candidatus Taylorbacteria bacterium]